MASIDFAPLVGALAPLAWAALSAVGAVALRQGAHSLRLKVTDQQRAAIAQACDAAAQGAYGFLVANGAHYLDVPIRNAAIAEGVTHVLASVPQALAAEGLTPEHVHAMVDKRLGGLLAKDPTASITPPTIAPIAGFSQPAAPEKAAAV